MVYNNEGLQKLNEELERTAVVSDHFKRFIMAWATRAVEIAYEKGKADAERSRVA